MPLSKTSRPSSKPDFATFFGMVIAFGGMIGGLLLEKGQIQDILQGTAAMIVLGGTIGAVLVTTPLSVFRRAVKALTRILVAAPGSVSDTIEAVVVYAAKTRRSGIVSLETDVPGIADPFLRKALGLAVDGTDLQDIKEIMEIDIITGEQAAEAEARVWDAAGGYAPTIGIIGAVMGLIQVMKHLEDIKEVGHGIAVAFVATVYGVGSANLFFLPAAQKLRAHMRHATLLKEVALEGVAGIVQGLNPTLIRLKLSSFDPHPDKGSAARAKQANSAAAPQAVSAGE